MAHENRAAEDVSREHVDHVLKRERRSFERLHGEIGHEAATKLDRTLARDLAYEYRQRGLDRLFGAREGQRDADGEHRVMVMMKGARRRPTARPLDRSDRRRSLAAMQRSGRRATSRLEKDIEPRPRAEVLESFWLTHSVAVAASSDEVVRLANRGDVASVSAIKTRFALALDVSRPLIGANTVEDSLGFTGRGVRVAVLDTGVDAAHTALAGVVASQTDMTGASGGAPEGIGDLHGHGTHCAGVIASQDGTRRGIAPGATIDDIKILNQFGGTDQTIAVAGIQAAVTAGVDVASNSWGFTHANGNWADPPAAGQPDGTCVLCVAADNAVAAGVVFVVAAGNENNDSCATYDTHIRCPGLAADAVTVAASTDGDDIADFSSIGPTPDGRAKPDIAAPGEDIGSCRASGTSMGSPIDADWTDASGTSMACPHVAGVAALMIEKNNTITPAVLKGALMTTAVNIGATPEEMGAGRVDAVAAVNAA